MKLRVVLSLIFSISLSLSANAMSMKGTGLMMHKVFNPNRNRHIEVHFWYPSETIHADFAFGQNRVFVGSKTSLNAAIAKGKYPVILLSHGGLHASKFHSGWIASGLAKKGAIVVVPQPPGFSHLKPDLAVNELWLRPSDLSRSLTHLGNMAFFKASLDKDKVYAVGFFLGGTAALSLAGATFDPVRYQQSCKQKNINVDCEWLQKNNVDLSKVSDTALKRSNKNNQIGSVIAINPELTKTFDPKSLRNISIPVKLIDIRKNSAEKPALDMAASLQQFSNITRLKIPNSNLWSAFSLCTEQASAILLEEGGSNICKEPGKKKREDVHRQIIEEIINFINLKEK